MANTNIRPYFDDYNEDKQFYQILFRPSYPIQARELNQIQSILQEQVARHGRNIFKEGSMVIPGQVSVDTNVDYVVLQSTYNGSSIDSYVENFVDEFEVVGLTSGVRAKVVFAQKTTANSKPTLWVKYVNSGLDGLTKTFIAGESIVSDAATQIYATVESQNSLGKGSLANIQRGVYFVNSRFVLAKEQTIVLDEYSNRPSYKIGLRIIENFVTPEEDNSLYDNAQGSTNEAAPGAHRYFIDLILDKISIDNTDEKNFIELVRVVDGVQESRVIRTEYSIIEDAMARRTFDESGNYAISAFSAKAKENRNNDRGQWTQSTQYFAGDIVEQSGRFYVAENDGTSGLVAPSHEIGTAVNGTVIFRQESNPTFNQGYDLSGDRNKISIEIDSGKAYVYGYEIDKIAKSNVVLDKALDFDSVRNGTVQTTIGSYVYVDRVFGTLNTTQFPLVQLRDRFTSTNGTAAGTQIGTARARYIEYHTGTIGQSSCQYVLSLFDIKLNAGKKFSSDVRQIYFQNGSGANFTCDMKKELKILSGSITTTSGSGTVNGIGTRFLSEISVGDSVGYVNGGNIVSEMVVSQINSDTQFVSSVVASATVSNSPAYQVFSTLFEGNRESLIFKMPKSNIRKIKDVDDESNTTISYYVRQAYSGIVSGGNLVISTTSSSETFASPQQPDAFHVVASTGEVINASIVLNGTSNVATISVNTYFNGTQLNVIATIKKTAKERTKTIVRAFSEDITTEATTKLDRIPLSKVDGVRLLKVFEFTNGSGVPVAFGSAIPVGSIAVDITNRYSFDSGNKDAFYDFASITNTSGVLPRSPIRIVYDHMEHSSIGDYFSVDSYQKIEDVTHVSSEKEELKLFDCLDFRPTRTTSGFSASLVPAIGFDITCDYSYFLPRYDKIALNSSGNFVVSKGSPAEVPAIPETPENSMLLYTALIKPSQFKVDVSLIKEDNRRYTMRDIGNLEKRLSNVEYFTSLSLLETQTKNLQLFDELGNLMFKNGFIVDPFNDQRIADTSSVEFKAAIDVIEGTMRPTFKSRNVRLKETASNKTDRLNQHYVENNGILTLPFKSKEFINQSFASTTESVTPFIKINFIGNVDLTPSSDEWYETEYRPDFVVEREGNFEAVTNQFKQELGTVWNDWQTTWIGVSSRRISVDNFRNQTTTTSRVTTTTTNQARSGVNTFIQAIYDREIVGDRVVFVDIIPFVRSRTISFIARGLKANTRLSAFFDNVNVTQYVKGTSTITLSNRVGNFDMSSAAGSSIDSPARQITTNSILTSIGTGDILHNGTGGNIALATATAIVAIEEDDIIRVINVKGTFTPGQTVHGSISGASGIVQTVTLSNNIMTNGYGEVAGTFEIPSSAKVKFRTGNRNFVLTDSLTDGEDFTTRAVGVYSANGYKEYRERTIVSTRNGVLAKENVSDTRTLTSTTTTVLNVQGWGDPLAQSFLTPVGNGVFIESIDVFFASKDRSLPVFCEIREMENGYPTSRIVPGSKVALRAKDVLLSNNSSVATKFKMNYPIYLDPETEYCFVLSSDSAYYTVWVSQLGQNDILTGRRISDQPYLGSVFKSQNSTTWTADQMQDVKFRMNICEFDISKSANIEFQNTKTDRITLSNNAIQTKSGSNRIRIRVPNHGIPVGSNIVISGLTTSVNGISAANINGSRQVLFSEIDFVVVAAGANATSSGNSNFSESVTVNQHITFDVANLISNQIQLSGTSLRHFIRGINSSYVIGSNSIELLPHENTTFKSPIMIASEENEAAFNGGKKSISVYASMTSVDPFISPVIDLTNYSIVAISNRIDSNGEDKNVDNLDDDSQSVSVTFGANGLMTGSLGFLQAGQTIKITGATNTQNNVTTIVESVGSGNVTVRYKSFVVETSTVTITSYNRKFDEISSKGTSEAKYIMKQMNLTTKAEMLKVFFDVSSDNPASFDLYYRLSSDGADLPETWVKASPVAQSKYLGEDQFFGMEYNIKSSIPFNSAQVKIVMNSSNTSIVPSIKQLRMIAST